MIFLFALRSLLSQSLGRFEWGLRCSCGRLGNRRTGLPLSRQLYGRAVHPFGLARWRGSVSIIL